MSTSTQEAEEQRKELFASDTQDSAVLRRRLKTHSVLTTVIVVNYTEYKPTGVTVQVSRAPYSFLWCCVIHSEEASTRLGVVSHMVMWPDWPPPNVIHFIPKP